jgi:hypothetical protein
MSRTKGRRDDGRRDTDQREPEERRTGQPEHREARDFTRDTGYQPSANQGRHEPLPASHHAEHGQEAVRRNEEANEE